MPSQMHARARARACKCVCVQVRVCACLCACARMCVLAARWARGADSTPAITYSYTTASWPIARGNLSLLGFLPTWLVVVALSRTPPLLSTPHSAGYTLPSFLSFLPCPLSLRTMLEGSRAPQRLGDAIEKSPRSLVTVERAVAQKAFWELGHEGSGSKRSAESAEKGWWEWSLV